MNKIVTAAAIAVLAVITYNTIKFVEAEYKFAKFASSKGCELVANTGKSVVVEGLTPMPGTYKPKVYKCGGLGPNTYIFAD